MDAPSYISGFVDGEGCFSVSFNKRAKLAVGIECRPSFSVSQHKRNKNVITQLHTFFKVGGVRFSKHDQNYKFEVRSVSELWGTIIPHFKKYPLQTSKANDFRLFTEIIHLMRANKHVSPTHLPKIIDLAFAMNEAGKRKYTKQTLLSVFSKMKR